MNPSLRLDCANSCRYRHTSHAFNFGTPGAMVVSVIPLLKLISNLSQALVPVLSFEMIGFAAFMFALLQNILIGIDTRRESVVRETSRKTN